MDIYALTNDKNEYLSKEEINAMLKEIGISDEAIQKGDSEAIEADAEKNNIDLDELSTMAKDQGKEISGSGDTAKADYEQDLKTRGIPSDVIAQGQASVQAYADRLGIRLPEATGTSLNLQF